MGVPVGVHTIISRLTRAKLSVPMNARTAYRKPAAVPLEFGWAAGQHDAAIELHQLLLHVIG
jgi:hypothetical protein